MSIIYKIKKYVNSGRNIDTNSIYNALSNFSYVSFDVFDTLVKRNVEDPTDIFSIMEKSVGEGFKEKRIEAEKRARTELGKKEISIEDIYSYISLENRNVLMDLEIETEFKAIVPNLPIAALYNKCIEEGKTIYITSDMYWPETAVKTLLTKNGFGEYKKLYLSSTEQKLKSDGSLFQTLLAEEGLTADKIIHIGDSIKGDYEEPKRLGIRALRIPRFIKNIEFRGEDNNSSIELNYLNHFINNTVSVATDFYYQFGYAQFGKLLYGYVHWIHDEAVKRGIEKIFFLARDGYIMKQAYEACINDKSIVTKYLEVSRRSLRGPVLWMDCNYDTILKMVVNAKLVNIGSIFDGLGLDINEYKNLIEECGLSLDEIFDRNTINNDYRLRLLIETIKPNIIENSRKEYSSLSRYLEENGVNGKFAIVDIGYGGSMQRYLQQVLSQLGIEHDITGFYFAVADFYKKNMLPGIVLDLNGYLFDFQHNPSAVDSRSSFVGLFETLFLEQDGSVKRYLENGNQVIAERYPYEYGTNDEPAEDLKKIREIQRGAIDFVKNAASDDLMQYLKCVPGDYFGGLRSVGENPTLKDLNFLGDIVFYDEGMTEKLAAPKNILFYSVHLKQMKQDFLKCRWKTGFLKRLLKIKLPYQRIYEYLRSIG